MENRENIYLLQTPIIHRRNTQDAFNLLVTSVDHSDTWIYFITNRIFILFVKFVFPFALLLYVCVLIVKSLLHKQTAKKWCPANFILQAMCINRVALILNKSRTLGKITLGKTRYILVFMSTELMISRIEKSISFYFYIFTFKMSKKFHPFTHQIFQTPPLALVFDF